ncbi:hypothetical protein EV182_006953, partial [Spiromyces aspiralis]
MAIGRDLVRILQDIATIPEIAEVWQDILVRPSTLCPEFAGIEQILSIPTPSGYLMNRVPFEMDEKLRHILKHLKWNMYQRNFEWFVQRYLTAPESEPLYCDIIRFICGVFHPSNQLLASEVVPRYVIIGALLRTIRSPTAAANAKLALFYDWFFYKPGSESIMNIEPAILLMERSIEKYPYLTSMLIEFLMLEPDVYYPPLAPMIHESILAAMSTVTSSGVIRSLNRIYETAGLNPSVKQHMRKIFAPLLSVSPPKSEGTSQAAPAHAEAAIISDIQIQDEDAFLYGETQPKSPGGGIPEKEATGNDEEEEEGFESLGSDYMGDN